MQKGERRLAELQKFMAELRGRVEAVLLSPLARRCSDLASVFATMGCIGRFAQSRNRVEKAVRRAPINRAALSATGWPRF